MYTIIRQNRKSVALQIDDSLEVVVKVPRYLDENEIHKIVLQYTDRIEALKQQKKEYLSVKDWINDKEILYYGTKRKIDVIKTKTNKRSIKYINGTFHIEINDSDDKEMIKELMESYWKQEAKIILPMLTDKYCSELGCNVAKVSIRNQKTRWGSCSSKGNITYNVKLLGAPIEVIRYVVLHEVLHLVHFNHSGDFWDKLEEVMPDYKEHKSYLKNNGIYLGF